MPPPPAKAQIMLKFLSCITQYQLEYHQIRVHVIKKIVENRVNTNNSLTYSRGGVTMFKCEILLLKCTHGGGGAIDSIDPFV